MLGGITAAHAAKKLKAPKEGGNLVIGRVIAAHQENQRVYYGGMNLVVVYEIVEDGEKKIKGRELSTDGDGYFRWENAPDGNYNLKGFRMPMGRRGAVTIISHLQSRRDQYFTKESDDVIPFNGRRFIYKPENRVIDMQNHIFYYARSGAVTHDTAANFGEFEIASEQVEADYVHKYFLNTKKYNKSGWTEFLEADLERAQGKGQAR